MPRTEVRGGQVKDSGIQRDDLDAVTSGQAVIKKVVAGTNVSLSSTGADAGTGDVTVNVPNAALGVGSAIDSQLAEFDGTGGKQLKASRKLTVSATEPSSPSAGDIWIDTDQVVDETLITKPIGLTIDGAGSAITTGIKGYITIPFGMTITGWTILADQVGSIVIDVWKDTYANFPPTVADTIAGSEKPTLSSAQKNQDLTLTTWTTSIAAGDVLGFKVDSVSTVNRVTLILQGTLV